MDYERLLVFGIQNIFAVKIFTKKNKTEKTIVHSNRLKKRDYIK